MSSGKTTALRHGAPFSSGLFAVLVAANVTAVVQAALFVDPSLPRGQVLGHLAETLLRVVGWAGVWTLAVGLVPWARARRLLGGAIVVASVALFGIDSFMLVHFHNVLDAGLLEIVLATNPAEATEYVASQAGGIAATALALGAVVAAGRTLWRRQTRRATSERKVALVLILLLAFAASLAHAAADPDDRVAEAARTNSLVRLALNAQQAREEIGSSAYVAYTLASHDVSRTQGTDDIAHVVFILGESTSRHHMQLYGYGLPTTPRLAARDAAGELIVFEHVTSPHAGTMAVMRTLFSFYDRAAEDAANGMWYDYGDLFDILRAAGVTTAWLSNQEASGFYGSIGRTLGERTDHVAFTSPVAHSIDLAERYDEEVLPLVDDWRAERATAPAAPAFTVIHLMGAHEEFSRRYPPAYAQFTAEDERERGVTDDESALAVRATYDNAVLYDDAIVDAIIEKFEAEDAIVIFISDHGEEVYDTRAQFGHGDETSPWQRDVPMVCWLSPRFRAQHPADVQRLAAARMRHWRSDEMIHTLLDLMKIRTPEFDETKSLLAPEDAQAEE